MVLSFLKKKNITDQCIYSELNLPQGKLLLRDKVIDRTKHGNGDATDSYDLNSFLSTLIYEVEFSNGEIKESLANGISENTHSQADEVIHDMKILILL